MYIVKRNGQKETFNVSKIENAIIKAFKSVGYEVSRDTLDDIISELNIQEGNTVEEIQDLIINTLRLFNFNDVADSYFIYRYKHNAARESAKKNELFINNYKKSSNTANATVDDNSNVNGKNIGILNAEIHKEDNIRTSRVMLTNKLKELFPNFDAKNYVKDLENHIIYKHDESSFCGPISPYCCSISMYPFLLHGIKDLGGLSARPKNLDSYCGMFINLIFAVAGQFAGAVATSEFFILFDFFARKEWGDNYYLKSDTIISNSNDLRQMTIQKKIHQYFQQVVYSINQPASARGMQAAFVNFSYFDKPFFESMFGNFMIPKEFDELGNPTEYDSPKWDSVNWLQKDFIKWFNNERLKEVITFPVESFALIYKDGKFVDEENAKFVAKMQSEGHSFFVYISDTADSLSSCCRLKNKVTTHEFNFTNGNLGVETGSKSVISLNLSRIIQDWYRTTPNWKEELTSDGRANISNTLLRENYPTLKVYLQNILDRVYKYQIAYNEYLWDMFNSGLLPVYSAGFISLDKQYLTIGLNGLNSAAEFLGLTCNNNKDYQDFCNFIFGTIKDYNTKHKGKYFGHKVSFNTEQVPAESLAVKNYKWDKADGYWVNPNDTLYASYIYKPNNPNLSPLDKMILHGSKYIGDWLDGGSAAHINLSEHLSYEQNWNLLNFAAKNGCQYYTYNVPNCKCTDCGFITKHPIKVCPKCGSTHINWYDRIIGYLTCTKNWSDGRRKESRHYYGDNGFDRINDKVISNSNA